MSSLNKAMLIGRLGRDPEIRHTQDGKPIANFSIATSEKWKTKQGEAQERTEWHTIVIFNENLARLAEKYLVKGSQVYIEGVIRTRKWTDKDGNDRYSTEIVLDSFSGNMRFLGSKQEGTADQAPAAAGASASKGAKPKSKPEPQPDELDDEVPF